MPGQWIPYNSENKLKSAECVKRVHGVNTNNLNAFTTLNSLQFFFMLLFLLWATSAHAEWYKDYEAGLDFIRKGRYAEAIPRLQLAIAQKDQEGLNIKFYGMKFDNYVPHYYLGRAYFYQKNYQAALDELNISSSQGEIQRNRNLFQNLSELKTLATAQMNLNSPTPPLIAEKKPEPVQPKPEPVQPRKEPVIEEKKPEPQLAIREQPGKVALPVVQTEPPKPAPEPVQSVEDTNLQRAKILTKDGARRYFQGDFDSAISAFSSALQITPRDVSAQFLLGCSYAAKYLLSGSSDQKSFQKASAAFQKIRRMNPNHPLTKSPLISPAVREIYQKTSGA